MDSQAETALIELNGKFERMMDNIEKPNGFGWLDGNRTRPKQPC